MQSLRAAALALAAALLPAQSPAPAPPVTAAELSGFAATSTAAEVAAFVEALRALPGGGRLTTSTFGKSHEGRDLLVVHVDPQGDGPEVQPLRVLVLANIHGGEVCGKEAVQILLREIAGGEHDDWLRQAELWVVPVYNVDGNERIATTNRSNVNGPPGGLGERENAQGFDLNRDCIKAESPEFRALLGLYRRYDPHVLFDLHTTNGSPHAYHLTYAPPLSPNTDGEIDRFLRDVHLPAVRAAMLDRHGYRVFDYGNFGRRGPRAWATFDHTPRFATNYYGLRNRLAILSEAYAYEPFEVRVRATRAFVVENLRHLLEHRAEVLALCDRADARALAGDLEFGWDAVLDDGEPGEVLVGAWDAVPLPDGRRRMQRRSEFRAESMPIRVAFHNRERAPLPAEGWAVLAPSAAVVGNLQAHGIEFDLVGTPTTRQASAFVPSSGDRARREFQGHRTIALRGDWQPREIDLPEGTLLVPSRQRLAVLAAQLLEPQSDDGLTTWGFFEAQTVIGASGSFPVLRL